MNLFDWMEKEENKNNTEDVKSTNISSISQEEHLEDNKLESPLEIKMNPINLMNHLIL